MSRNVQSSAADISFVLIGGDANFRELDQVRFESVPEPGTLALFSLGMLGLAFCLRRRPKQAERVSRPNSRIRDRYSLQGIAHLLEAAAESLHGKEQDALIAKIKPQMRALIELALACTG